MRDLLSAESGEMADGKPRATLVVRQKAKRVRVLDLREHIDNRQAARRRLDRSAPVGPPRGDHETVNPLAQELVDMAPLARGIVGGVAHEDGNAVIEQAPLERFDDRKGEPAEAVIRENADRHRARSMQALCEIVRPIVDSLGDFKDLGPCFGAEPAIGVERLRGGSDRDAGESRDVVDGPGSWREIAIAGWRAIGRTIIHLTAPESKPEM